MLLVRFEHERHTGYGRIDGDDLIHLTGPSFDQTTETGLRTRLSDARLLAPVAAPRIFGTAFTSRSQLAALGKQAPTRPFIFMKPHTSVIGPGDPIAYPRQSTMVDFEGEIAVVIGKKCRNSAASQAMSFVFGYTCCNDVSERTIQFDEMKYGALFLGKAIDTFCPLGPTINTDIELSSLVMKTYLNGEIRQEAGADDFVFGVADIITYLSAAITLLPGDVILMGSPAGYGEIKPGDRIDVEIEGIGRLTNPVVAE
ncbi:MAG TPA: fumarylacetoacetate hydrolase family protein [Afipia sp.]